MQSFRGFDREWASSGGTPESSFHHQGPFLAHRPYFGDPDMSSFSRSRIRLARRLSWLLVAGMTTAALVGPSTSSVFAASVTPIPISDGNPTCDDFDGVYGGGQPWLEVKSDPPGNETINVPGFGSITVSSF